MWIVKPGLALNWMTGNTALTYDATDAWAINPRIYDYRVLAGPIAGGTTIATKRFGYPSQFEDRTDAFQGLG